MEKIKFEDWKKIDLRVGQIKSVEDHPNADKLYVLNVNFGDDDIQLVAGLKGSYERDELLGKKIVVIKNLEPIALRGVESQGMLLAAVSEGKVSLITPEKDIEIGSKVE